MKIRAVKLAKSASSAFSENIVEDYARNSLRASSPIWVSETSRARTLVLTRLASLAQIGELARTLRS